MLHCKEAWELSRRAHGVTVRGARCANRHHLENVEQQCGGVVR
jgi:hypothetical protein